MHLNFVCAFKNKTFICASEFFFVHLKTNLLCVHLKTNFLFVHLKMNLLYVHLDTNILFVNLERNLLVVSALCRGVQWFLMLRFFLSLPKNHCIIVIMGACSFDCFFILMLTCMYYFQSFVTVNVINFFYFVHYRVIDFCSLINETESDYLLKFPMDLEPNLILFTSK